MNVLVIHDHPRRDSLSDAQGHAFAGQADHLIFVYPT